MPDYLMNSNNESLYGTLGVVVDDGDGLYQQTPVPVLGPGPQLEPCGGPLPPRHTGATPHTAGLGAGLFTL